MFFFRSTLHYSRFLPFLSFLNFALIFFSFFVPYCCPASFHVFCFFLPFMLVLPFYISFYSCFSFFSLVLSSSILCFLFHFYHFLSFIRLCFLFDHPFLFSSFSSHNFTLFRFPLSFPFLLLLSHAHFLPPHPGLLCRLSPFCFLYFLHFFLLSFYFLIIGTFFLTFNSSFCSLLLLSSFSFLSSLIPLSLPLPNPLNH